MEKQHTVLFYGRPGAGKGTQAELLVHNLAKPVIHFEFGSLVREFMQGSTAGQRYAKEILEAGGLLPKFLGIGIWSDFFFKNLSDNQHLVIDGAPRQLFEAEALDSLLLFYKRPVPMTVVHLEVSEETARKRLIKRAETQGRIDDIKRESLERRLGWFTADTMPVLDFFVQNSQYNVITINGEQSVEKVQADIAAAILS